MESKVLDFFTEQILRKGAHLFEVAPDELIYIGAWQNLIYEYNKGGESYILRFTPSSHRSESAVVAELDWILYLAHSGVSVSNPIGSNQGNLVEVVTSDDNFYFTAASFIKAKGEKIGYPECLSDTKLYQHMGQLTGKIHTLSKRYQPREGAKRHSWENNYYLRSVGQYIPLEQRQVHEQCEALIKEIQETLPTDGNSFGLIHGDINTANFHVNEKGITLFDFDEAQYSWFVEDIAIPLYYLVYVYGDDSYAQRVSQANLFMEHFLKGYTLECSVEDYWLKRIPLFLRMREIIVYTGMYRSTDVAKLDQWGLDFISQSKTRIENGMPILDVWK